MSVAVGEIPQSGEVPSEQPIQGLLLSGEGVSFLTDEHRDLLRQVASSFAGGRAVELAVVDDAPMLGVSGETEPEPVLATQGDFLGFAEVHEYTRTQAFRAWSSASFVAAGWYEGRQDPYPSIIFPKAYKALDLRSVHERLVASYLGTDAWIKAGRGTVNFLAHIVNEKVQPDEPLDIRPPQRPAAE